MSTTKAEKALRAEARQIKRLEGEKAKPKGPLYLYYLLLILSLVYIADEVTSQIGTQMQSIIAQSLFAPVFGADVALARMKALGGISVIGMILAIPYKTLSDRYGRKRFLVINTFGMGTALVLISVSTSIPVYLLSAIMLNFFTPHDMQAVYILESAPPKHRAKIYSIVKAVSTVGVMLIPLLRNVLMGSDTSRWRTVYLAAAVFAMIAALISLLAVRESDVFVNERLAYLKKSSEDRQREKQEKSPENARGGLLPAARLCMKNKQLRWLIISAGFMMWGMLFTQYYEPTMTNGYAAQFLEQGMSLQQAHSNAAPAVTQALFLFPVGSALLQLLQGFLADKWGRKPAVITMCICSVSAYILFCIGSVSAWTPYFVGFLCGAAIGSYWATGDIAGSIMCSESAPTNLRSSVLTVQPIISGLIFLPTILLSTILINVLGDTYAGWIGLCVAVPGMLVGLITLSLKVRDTRGVDLNEVTGTEPEQKGNKQS